MSLQEIVSFVATFVGLLATLSVFLPRVNKFLLIVIKRWLGIERMEAQVEECLRLLRKADTGVNL